MDQRHWKITSKLNFKNYDVPVLHSGKIYRALAVEMLRNKININSHREIIKCVSNISHESLTSKNDIQVKLIC